MDLRAAAVVGLSIATLALAGCRGDRSDDNADQFRDRVAALEAGARLDPQDGDAPGIVSGSIPAAPGGGLAFTFSFGPDAVDISDDFPERDETIHFSSGDGYFASIGNSPAGLGIGQQNKRYDLELALQDAACEAAAGNKCESSEGK